MSRIALLFPSLGYAPLLPAALAFTAGVSADRCLSLSFEATSMAALICLLLSGCYARVGRSPRAMLCLWAGALALGAAYHHSWRNQFPLDDIGNFTQDRAFPLQIRGRLDEEPARIRQMKHDPLISVPAKEPSAAIVEVNALEQEGIWLPASGRVKFYVDGELTDLHNGDEIECVGWLIRPPEPSNPGEWDRRSQLLDQRIRAEFRVRKTSNGVVRIAEGWRSSFFGWLAVVRGWGQRSLHDQLSPDSSNVAGALLLGDGSTMTRADWEKYIRTGVIHVLAISGQHLVVLAGALWLLVRVLDIRRRRAALVIAALMLTYALLTGGRPSAMRSAVMVGAVAVGIVLRKPALPANTFALAWLIVLFLQPTDLFNAGFQLSFLAVAVLIWGMPHWFPARELSALEQLVEESRPLPLRILRSLGRIVFEWYRITLVLALALAPQVMYWQNLISLAGLLIGPPLVLLTSIALIAGFLLLLLSPLSDWLAAPFAWITGNSIAACEWIVGQADRLPLSHIYVGLIPGWWLIGFYAIGFAWLCRPYLGAASPLSRLPKRGSTWLAGLGLWCCVGLAVLSIHPKPDEFRLTFVAVGHGGCTVLETPDGRTLLYDAGSLSGAEAARRSIAPFLWSRGIHRIDELFLSHGDLDHFNGLPALTDRFTIGQVTVNPSFFDKQQPGVKLVEELLKQEAVPVRVAKEGDVFKAGEVTITVLHPPSEGLPGPDENQRSMVLLLEHHHQRILLTGDLTGPGLTKVLGLPKTSVDVLMAPHHGSSTSNNATLLEWARPRLAIVCEEVREEPTDGEKEYARKRIPLWSTATQGAITLHSHRTGLVAETFRTKQRLVVKDGDKR